MPGVEDFVPSPLSAPGVAKVQTILLSGLPSPYGGGEQRWILIHSESRQPQALSDFKQGLQATLLHSSTMHATPHYDAPDTVLPRPR
jgi:hypothetical protein